MSDHPHYFESGGRCCGVLLPFDLDAAAGAWDGLRQAMVRRMPAPFARDEWAYLITFLDKDHLLGFFESTFGARADRPRAGAQTLVRPRGTVAVWLPNNANLLGPLVLMMLSLTGNAVRSKGGSESQDLAGSFLKFALESLPGGPLRSHLESRVRHEVFGHDDPRNAEMAAGAQVRIVFGSDASAGAIHALPHPVESLGFSFVDRHSEAWVEKGADTDAALETLIKVFSVFGQAGCTAPRRVVLLDGTLDEARGLRDRLSSLWPRVMKSLPAAHVASGNVMARQWSAALGWDAYLVRDNAAVLATGAADLPLISAPMALAVVSSSLEGALASLPPNVQTIGYAAKGSLDGMVEGVWRSRVKRLVPIAQMHHFGPVWDGHAFWRQTFEEMQVTP